MDNSHDRIAVVGAGLAGSMFALMLGKRGFFVDVYEKRPDFRVAERTAVTPNDLLGQSTDSLRRSINLALSFRGQEALRAVGLLDDVMAHIVPMPARGIHDLSGAVTLQPYGKPGQFICSASRSLLNRTLLDACDRLPNVRCYFETSVKSLDADNRLTLRDERSREERAAQPRLVVGSDGAYSAVRTAMLRYSRMDFSREYIDHAYKELTVPAVRGPDGAAAYALPQPHALHIWPRHDFMMIALPNPDMTFTCTLFLPWALFAKLDADPVATVRPFFETHFPDVLPVLPQLEAQFKANPTSALVMVKAKPWNLEDRQLLIGDAAHSVVPFYGQGANAAFEDCLFFTECLDACRGDLSAAVRSFAVQRKPAADALASLSLANYVEMRHKTVTRSFMLRKRIDGILSALMPTSWIPMYSMVAFTRIPYHDVIARAERQDRTVEMIVSVAASLALGAGAVAVLLLGRHARVWARLADAWSGR